MNINADALAAFDAGMAEKQQAAISTIAHLQENEPESGSEGQETDDAIIERLAKLSPIEYDRCRKTEAKAMGVSQGTLDKAVAAAMSSGDDTQALDFPEVEPWVEPVDPAALLTDISGTVRRFIICQRETADAVALWAAMTWFVDAAQVCPLAVITAPEKRCGKSQLLFLLGKLVCRPLMASNISPAAVFRAVDAWRPTLLVDETDSFLKDNEELRGIINSGHTRDSAYVVRVVGEDLQPKRFSTWGAKALAGIGHLADTLMDRAITLELRRKLPHEQVDRLRHAEPDLFQILTEKLARFSVDHMETVRRARPALPDSLHDRAQDNWEPLLAIADIAGGVWPELARAAALKLSGSESPTTTTGNELLADIQEVFEAKAVQRISTADLIASMTEDDEKPWATYNRGKPISPRQLSKKLSDYGIRSKTIRIGYGTSKGFELEQFADAFARYLSATLPENPSQGNKTLEANNDEVSCVTEKKSVTETQNETVTLEPTSMLGCDGVTDKKGVSGRNYAEVEL